MQLLMRQQGRQSQQAALMQQAPARSLMLMQLLAAWMVQTTGQMLALKLLLLVLPAA